MAGFTRPDGTVAASAPGYRRFMPALMPTRNGSAVFFEQKVRVEGTERFVQAVRAAHPDVHVTVFEVLLWALAHTFDRHPNINRFVAGGRLYDRTGIWISFTVKTELSEAGTLLEVKHRFDPTQDFVELARELEAAVAAARAAPRAWPTRSSSCSCTCRRRCAVAWSDWPGRPTP